MRSVAHIVNICAFPQASEHHSAQAVTLETMRIAAGFAEGSVAVRLLSAQFPEDRVVVPEFFSATPDLERSVLDVGAFRIRRRLPLMQDILDRAHEAAQCDFVIFTNADIGLLPGFYVSVGELVDSGLDAFSITRRSISGARTTAEEIPLMWAEVGKSHPGYDCFVFRREAIPSFQLGLACIGAPYVGKVLLANMIMNSGRFEVFRDLHLTFHIGDLRTWRSKSLRDYEIHNRREFGNVMRALGARGHPLIKKHIRADCLRRMRNWLLD